MCIGCKDYSRKTEIEVSSPKLLWLHPICCSLLNMTIRITGNVRVRLFFAIVIFIMILMTVKDGNIALWI